MHTAVTLSPAYCIIAQPDILLLHMRIVHDHLLFLILHKYACSGHLAVRLAPCPHTCAVYFRVCTRHHTFFILIRIHAVNYAVRYPSDSLNVYTTRLTAYRSRHTTLGMAYRKLNVLYKRLSRLILLIRDQPFINSGTFPESMCKQDSRCKTGIPVIPPQMPPYPLYMLCIR